MSETWADYFARRLGIIAQRERRPTQDQTAPDDTHGKAGCFECDFLAFGPSASRAAADHRIVAKHQIWIIGPPMD